MFYIWHRVKSSAKREFTYKFVVLTPVFITLCTKKFFVIEISCILLIYQLANTLNTLTPSTRRYHGLLQAVYRWFDEMAQTIRKSYYWLPSLQWRL